MQRPTKKSVYRVERKNFWLGILFGFLFLAMAIFSFVGMLLFPSGQERIHHIYLAFLFGGFWSCWVLLSIWQIALQVRYRLIIDRKGIQQTGIFRSFFVPWHKIAKMRWFNFPHPGGVSLRGDFRKMNIHFGNFDENTRTELENLFAEMIPKKSQIRAEQYKKTKEKRCPKPNPDGNKPSPTETAIYLSVLFLLGVSFICFGFFIDWRSHFGGALILSYSVYRAILLIRAK